VFLGSTSEGGFGAGNGAAGGSAQSGGGGGLGAGGAIFVRAGSSLSMTDVTMTGDSVSAGSGADGGQNGSAIGQGLFLGNTTTWSVSTDKTITIAESIGGGQNADANGGVTKSGAGTLALTAVNSYVGLTTINAGTLALGYSFDGTSGTLPATNSILVNSGGTLMLGNTAGEANVIGSGLNAPNVSIPAITLTGGSLTSFNGTTHNLGVLSMTGGTVAGTPDPSAGYNDFTLNSAIAVNATTTSSFITAPGGIGLRDNIPFNVSSGTGNLTISAALRDEPGITGGITKNQAGSMILTGSDTYTAGTVVNAGLLVFGSSTAFPSNTALTINGGKSAFTDLTVGATFVTQLNSLSIAGSAGHWSGLLDLSNTDLVIHNAQLATITDQIAQGSNNGTWTGTAGITSSAAAGDTNHLTALGVILNGSTYGTATGSLGTFDGLNPAAGDVLIKYTYFGDTNLDGKVDGSDYSRIDNGAINHLTGWFNGDFNYDGIINGSDYTLIDNAFNTQGSQLTAAVSTPNALATSQVAGTSSVPEPATFCLVTGLMLALLGRRNISVNESARLRTGA
jgi:fibronectin-binding autotransporter adhesin